MKANAFLQRQDPGVKTGSARRFASYPGLACAAVVLVLGACSATPVKEISQNQSGYLAQNFVPKVLPESVLKTVEVSPTGSRFSRATISLQGRGEEGGKASRTTVVAKFNALANGLVQEMWEHSANEVPYGLTYALTYVGVFALKMQTVYFARSVSEPVTEVSKVSRFDSALGKPRENSEYVIEYEDGGPNQLAKQSRRLSCKSAKFYSATEVHPNLAGRAIDLSCEMSRDTVLRLKRRYVFLENYGFAILMSHQMSNQRTDYTVVAAEVI